MEVIKWPISLGGCDECHAWWKYTSHIQWVLRCWCEPLAKGHASSFTRREPLRFTLVLTSTSEYAQKVIQAFLPLCEADIIISKTFRKHLIFMFFRKQGLLKLNYYSFAYTSFLPRGDLGNVGTKWLYYGGRRQFLYGRRRALGQHLLQGVLLTRQHESRHQTTFFFYYVPSNWHSAWHKAAMQWFVKGKVEEKNQLVHLKC